MATAFEIPITTDESSFKIRTVLEGVELVFHVYWNTRQNRWTVDILDASENMLLAGQTLNINMELIERFEIVGLPPGKMMLFDSTNRIEEALRDDLGDRSKMLYVTSV